ncbi:hypothetical protein OV208_11420 [Corallococcus sp. bb12-1]|uniref:hypothetical protein n=1 Tax=Corallococcus sp. bb12-1 TaxID=2996784 RepID=UPI00226FD491|nr:hypothetical protein [Corallococcus sp. bb12-1]MCY1041924.1 hypothetical protein [Corallococcus sp. bb12-1]
MAHHLHASIARYEIQQLLQGFQTTCDFRERLRVYRAFCQSLETLAFCALLGRADVMGFSRGLMRAALHWKALLEHARDHEPGARVPASWNGPLLGAICCGPRSFACELAALSARAPTPPEYDDEFLSALLLQEYLRSRFVAGSEPADLEVLCERMEDYLGKQTPRAEVYRAVSRRDGRLFPEAFQAWNEEVAGELRTRAEAPGAPPALEVGRYIWLEGMAVLKLAEEEGLWVPDRIHRLIPPLARSAPTLAPSAVSLLLGHPVNEQELILP